MEELEEHDWHIDNFMTNEERQKKSISAYYLNEWYEKIKFPIITFKTYIYPIIDNDIYKTCPDIMPFEKAMVRYENKSPKDSEFWGPVSNKNEVNNLFYTSLRCKKNKGNYLCIREWKDNIKYEFRCFWNYRLVAVCIQEYDLCKKTVINKILNYISQIELPYYRCVFDICFIDNDIYLIEFNSWESNSGGNLFNWIDDTHILYPDNSNIVFRFGKEDIIINLDNKISKILSIDLNFNVKHLKFIKPYKAENWLITDKYVYITDDIWLYRFDYNLKFCNRIRSIFRFSHIYLTENNFIKANNDYYYSDLTKFRNKVNYNILKFDNIPKIYPAKSYYKYGMFCYYNNKLIYLRFINNNFKIIDILN